MQSLFHTLAAVLTLKVTRMFKNILLIAFLLFSPALIGCGSGGGTVGDENDPATTTDDEQMTDETGEVSD